MHNSRSSVRRMVLTLPCRQAQACGAIKYTTDRTPNACSFLASLRWKSGESVKITCARSGPPRFSPQTLGLQKLPVNRAECAEGPRQSPLPPATADPPPPRPRPLAFAAPRTQKIRRPGAAPSTPRPRVEGRESSLQASPLPRSERAQELVYCPCFQHLHAATARQRRGL